MNIDEIKNPKDILEYMDDNIQYGWIDIYGNEHIKKMKDLKKTYKIFSIAETIEHGIGTCIEQVALMHYLLNKLNIKNKSLRGKR